MSAFLILGKTPSEHVASVSRISPCCNECVTMKFRTSFSASSYGIEMTQGIFWCGEGAISLMPQ